LAAKILGVLLFLPLLVSLSLLAFSLTPLNASKSMPPRVEWIKTYGGAMGDVGWSVRQTGDGGYIIVGSTSTYGSGSYDIWLIKTDSTGRVEWSRTYGGSEWDVGWCIDETRDGGYIIVGATMSYGSGHYDLWLIKTDERGLILWNLTYGGAQWDVGYYVQETREGGYIVAGCTRSMGSGDWDALLLRVDAEGGILWAKTYGGPYEDGAWHAIETRDGGYIIAGYRTPRTGGLADAWLIKTDGEGSITWSIIYGGDGDDWLFSVEELRDGYITAGSTGSYGAGDYDYWLIEVDEEGHILWNRTYGGPGREIAWKVVKTRDGGYILIGGTTTYGSGDWDIWLLKTDGEGRPQWNETYGDMGRDRGWGVEQTRDGGYILVGYTTPQGARHWDLMLIKLEAKNIRRTRSILILLTIFLISSTTLTLYGIRKLKFGDIKVPMKRPSLFKIKLSLSLPEHPFFHHA